jgi:predicted RNase H-like nuclease (RuvC/YqgF family)
VSNSVEPQTVDASAITPGDAKSIETGLKSLWESVRRAADTIARLREEKRDLQTAVERMEKELLQLRQAAAQLRRQSAEQGAAGGTVGPAGERDQLAARVKELIAKLDAYL